MPMCSKQTSEVGLEPMFILDCGWQYKGGQQIQTLLFCKEIQNTRDPSHFTAFLLLCYEVHHLQKFAEHLTLLLYQACPDTNIAMTL